MGGAPEQVLREIVHREVVAALARRSAGVFLCKGGGGVQRLFLWEVASPELKLILRSDLGVSRKVLRRWGLEEYWSHESEGGGQSSSSKQRRVETIHAGGRDQK